jgi:uncharacterized protein YcfJ
MKPLILASALIFSAMPALADYTVNGRVTDHFHTVTRNVPTTERVCETVSVPIHSSSGSTGNTIAGAIIGGAIGNQFGNGSGRDAMTVLGAIVGADVANRSAQNNSVTGYRQEQRCNDVTTYTARNERVYSHSTVTWREGNRTFTLQFQK